MEYILYCDESSSDGPKYSDFFGGSLVNSKDLRMIVESLQNKKAELNLHGEIKWTKVTANYLDKYKIMMDLFFNFVMQEKIKVRIMFRRTKDSPSKAYSPDDKYFKL